MSYFFRSGNTYSIAPADALNLTESLPAGNYTVKHEQFKGFYLEMVDGFTLPKKVYGDCAKNSERILNTFRDRDRNTGVLLVGDKGSGKTLLARKIAIDSNMPVIIVNTEFTGDSFNSFLSAITQPCIIFFDEFEKVFDKDAQEKILTLLDGTYQSRKLFLMTSNDKWRVDAHMTNRPGRIFYMMEFGGLDEQFVREYCEDNLLPQYQSRVSQIVQAAGLFDSFNFDLLAAFVEETNRYGESPGDLMQMLNAKPEYSADMQYSVEITLPNGMKVIPKALSEQSISVNTSTGGWEASVFMNWLDESEESNSIRTEMNEWDGSADLDKIGSWLSSGVLSFGRASDPKTHSHNYLTFQFEPTDISRYISSDQIEYVNDDKVKAVLSRMAKKSAKMEGYGL